MTIPATMTELAAMRCSPLAPGTGRLKPPELEAGLGVLVGWTGEDDRLSKRFAFENFKQTMAFVNAVAAIANEQDHHPDMHLSYSRCQVTWSTHSAGGVTLNDLICAARTEMMATSAGR